MADERENPRSLEEQLANLEARKADLMSMYQELGETVDPEQASTPQDLIDVFRALYISAVYTQLDITLLKMKAQGEKIPQLTATDLHLEVTPYSEEGMAHRIGLIENEAVVCIGSRSIEGNTSRFRTQTNILPNDGVLVQLLDPSNPVPTTGITSHLQGPQTFYIFTTNPNPDISYHSRTTTNNS